MSEPTYSPPDDSTGGEMRRIGTSSPDGDSLNFFVDDNTQTVWVQGTLTTEATSDTLATNPGSRSTRGTMAALLRETHSEMAAGKKPCKVKIEFELEGTGKKKIVKWDCHAQAW